ncbi:hypothetical protein K32_25780 [Kaistia sp. 32K]|uniref:substrate-binding domain-containing protein n=1 Tax=Kaistia sp. 32K TaxID=2795690 RepID=UPI0019156942|nr:substrate-binding domain-containing protein [Kaistia sp. 32K]BCP53961.1 hypothetical protein K32_25780 [Kaistia sp. 32K]
MIKSIKTGREDAILALLAEKKRATIWDFCSHIEGVSAVTIRRDIARMAEAGQLLRTHGGAALLPAGASPEAPGREASDYSDAISDVDAIILPPIEGRGADTLRMMARRRSIPFLAESSPQAGGVYLGPDNYAAGHDLGRLAGHYLSDRLSSVSLLLISLSELANTRQRGEGFLAGLKETFPGDIQVSKVEGHGSYAHSLRVSSDAFETRRDINVVFGVNDHSIMAAIEAGERLSIAPLFAFSVGGEGSALFDLIARGGKLTACAALFPEVVGTRAINALAAALNGGPMPAEIETPHHVLTSDNLREFYQQEAGRWRLKETARKALLGGEEPVTRMRRPASVGFVPHYPAHSWYRAMESAMRERATALGLELRVVAPQAGIAQEIDALRAVIAKAAVAKIQPGETVLVNSGVFCPYLSAELEKRTDVTIVTNSLHLMEQLCGPTAPKVIMTSGEYQPSHHCMVGPSLGALFETLRVDRAFLSVDGISAGFGVSSVDERLALAARRFISASRDVCILADHSLVGLEKNHRIAGLSQLTEIITDSGSLASDRLEFAAAGMRVTLADHKMENAPGEPDAWESAS